MKLLYVDSSPHIQAKTRTRHIMLDVVIALVPAGVASAILFGWRALLIIGVSVASCVLFEFLWNLALKKQQSVGDLTAVVTGVLLAFNLPATFPVWQTVIGALFSIVVVKQLFGGVGMNFANPAIAGRLFLAVSFPGSMTNYAYPASMPDYLWSAATSAASGATSGATGAVDAVSAATPLALIESGNVGNLDFLTLFLGNHGGVLGCTCALALIIGFLYLLIKKVIDPIIPLSFIGTVYIFALIYGSAAPFLSLFSGGLMLGAIFMATDYATSPYTGIGKLIFGFGCGFITASIRAFAGASEGVAYSILLMNLLVPYINEFTRKRPFGVVKAVKTNEK